MYYTVKEFSKRTILNLVFSIIQEAHLYASNKLENITGPARLTSIYFGGGPDLARLVSLLLGIVGGVEPGLGVIGDGESRRWRWCCLFGCRWCGVGVVL